MGFMIYYYSLPIIVLFLFVNFSFAHKCLYPLDSIYQFGDSIADTGNIIRVPGIGPTLPAARLPYGQTIGRSTGRFSDGLLIIDFIAMFLHLPLLNPYLDKNASFTNGVNFAVAGSTALDFAFFNARGIAVPVVTMPLGGQIGWFKQYLGSICSTTIECSTRFRRSLVFLGEIGGNDINYAFTQGKSLQEIRTYIPFITETIVKNARDVIGLGATRIIVPGNFPIGCFPATLTLLSANNSATPQEFDKFGCSRSYNDLAIYQNTYLQNALASLRMEFPNISLVYADYFEAFISVIARAPVLGFNTGGSLLKACCGIGGQYNYNGSISCGSPGVPVCPNPWRYIHWDGFHLTQEAYFRISQVLIPRILSKMDCF